MFRLILKSLLILIQAQREQNSYLTRETLNELEFMQKELEHTLENRRFLGI